MLLRARCLVTRALPRNPRPIQIRRCTLSVEEKYKTLTPQEHVLARPDMYIGSARKAVVVAWVRNEEGSLKHQEVEIIPGFAKIFDEMLVNVADNYHRTQGADCATTEMRVDINKKDNTITVYNNGRCVDVEWHKEGEAYCPELVFGRFQAGSNFDDSGVRVTGGRNGIGAKATNALSETFTVEIGDATRHKLYRQTWRDSMKECGEPVISDYPGDEEYTKITFKPLLKYFGLDSLDEHHVALFSRRVADISACCEGMKVYLNGGLLPVRNFEEYVKLRYTEAEEVAQMVQIVDDDEEGEESYGSDVFFTTLRDSANNLKWEIGVGSRVCTHLSFVNSIDTCHGGTHVEAVLGQVVSALDNFFVENHSYYISRSIIRENVSIFINSMVGNPEFDGQTKERLTYPPVKWMAQHVVLDNDILEEICNSEAITQPIIDIWEARLAIKASSAAKKRAKKISIAKLEDANFAGTPTGGDCTLILTEGDSAKSLAVAGLGIVGRDHWGVLPLRGKIMNVSKATAKKSSGNVMLQQIEQVMGLEKGIDYSEPEEFKKLRYGSICLMCDQDPDGSHIKGLVINWVNTYWPELLSDLSEKKPFLRQIVTPLIKVFTARKQTWFFSFDEYNAWRSENVMQRSRWRAKYYKGLGSSTSKEGKEYFRQLESVERPLMVRFKQFEEADTKALQLAFEDDRVQDRRRWLETCHGGVLDTESGAIGCEEFVNSDLASYFRYSNERAIPSCLDGLKPSQRKVLYTCFQRKLVGPKEMKVAQLGGAVAELTAYHHGEVSLHDCIIKLSQQYVGSGNNVPLLEGIGQFGTRLGGGSDHASARYISTRLSPLARKLFREEDDELLKPQVDEGKKLEPVNYVPVLPVVLLNGAAGIGTGHATTISSFDPLKVAALVMMFIEGRDAKHVLRARKGYLVPWYHGHATNGGYCNGWVSEGKVEGTEKKLVITELPVGVWTEKFKDTLDELQRVKKIKDYSNQSTEAEVLFKVMPRVVKQEKKPVRGDLVVRNMMKRKMGDHMKLFSPEGVLKMYATPEEICYDFFLERLGWYEKRFGGEEVRLREELVVQKKKLKICQLMFEKKIHPHMATTQLAAVLAKHKLSSLQKWLYSATFSKFTAESIALRAKALKESQRRLRQHRSTSPRDLWKVEVLQFVSTYVAYHGFTRDQLIPRLVDVQPAIQELCEKSAAP